MSSQIADILANMQDTYIVVDRTSEGLTYFRETDLGQSLADVVWGLANGQYDFLNIKTRLIESPIGVLRISREAPPEDVTEKVAYAILDYLEAHDQLYDEQGFLVRCPFLDSVWPKWEYQVRPGRSEPPEYDHEEFLERQERKWEGAA